LYIFSRDTTFIIACISNFEELKLKNSVKGHLNSGLNHENPELHHAFQAKPITKAYAAFANVVEDSLNFNFAIQSFPCSVQNFGEKSQSKCADQSVFLLSSRACALASAPDRASRSCEPHHTAGPPFGVGLPLPDYSERRWPRVTCTSVGCAATRPPLAAAGANAEGLGPRTCDNPPRKIPYYLLNRSKLVIKQ
jgi:hypothetical protein